MSRPRAVAERLPGEELRRRTIGGVLALSVRGVGVRLAGLAGTVVLARLLVPADFGTVAFAQSVLIVGTVLLDGGLGATLVRRPEEPSVADLRNVLAVQLVAAALVGGAVATAGLALGGAGEVTAVVMLALPLVAVRGTRIVLLQRRLAFGAIATVDVAEVVAYYGWAVLTVALGFGVWGFATAAIVKALVGTIILLRLAPWAPLRPALSRKRVKALLGFGVRVQAVDLLRVLRDQGLMTGTFVIAGASVLGLWAIATRVLQLLLLLFEPLWGVSFPAMSQLLASGEDPRPLMEKAVGVIAATTGLVATALVCSAPALVPGVFGADWGDAAGAVALTCIGLQVSSPLSSVTSGYFFASGATSVVVRSSLAQAVLWPAVALPLLPVVGVAALGIGAIAGAIAEAVILIRASRRLLGARLLAPAALPFAITVAISGAGWFATDALTPSVLVAVLGGLGGVVAYVATMGAVQRHLLTSSVDLLRGALRRTTQPR